MPSSQRQHRAGAAALSLLVHCTILVLAVLAAGGQRPPPQAPKLLLIALDSPPRATTPSVSHPLAPTRHKPGARPAPAPTRVAPQAEPAPVTARVADRKQPDAPPPAAAEVDAVAAAAPTEPPPLLYLAEVSRLIRLRLDYPARARLDRAQGTAVVHILLARDGTVLRVDLVQGAGHPALDEEARAVVLRIHKFPELPDSYARGEQRFAIDQPIGFRET